MVTKRIHYHVIPDFPKLGWVATIELDGGNLSVVHGPAVECRDQWMVEGVWDDDFLAGNFHCSENFFGSGIRIDGDRIYFVPSSALVDRLFYCIYRRQLLVSNSLILLLAFTKSTLDGNHDYNLESSTMKKGIWGYKKEFAVCHPEIDSFYQVYHTNIVLKDGHISYSRRDAKHDIGSFEHYYELLTKALGRIRSNYDSPGRKIRLSAFSTLSTGYDSTAVSCLARDIGVKTVFTGKKPLSSIPVWLNKLLNRTSNIEESQPIADALGLNCRLLDHRWSSIPEDELYFLAPCHCPPEIIFHSMAAHIEANCASAVVFTGYHGDKVWDAHTNGQHLNDQIVRGDISGLNLSEIRLKSGFFNVAIPFMFARNIRAIVEISRSAEMKPWRLDNSYDRPIPRRIAEGAGVGRHLFGMRKKVVIRRYNYPANVQLRRRFFRLLRTKHRVSPSAVYAYPIVDRLAGSVASTFQYLRNLILPTSGSATRVSTKNLFFSKDIHFHYLMHIWAIELLTERAARTLHKHIELFLKVYNTSADISSPAQ